MTRRHVIALFLLALGIRFAYQALVVYFGGSFHNGSDSGKYIWRALSLLQHGEVLIEIDGVLYPDFERMPLYLHFLAAAFWLADGELWIATLVQAVIDSASVFAVGLLAAAFDRRWALPATLLACLWPSFVVYAAWVLTDSLFVDLFAWGLCACLWAARGRHTTALLFAAGVAFGLAILTRPVLMYFPIVLLPGLAYLLWSKFAWHRALPLAVIPVAVMLLILTPRLLATQAAYGIATLSTQTGEHALSLVYPCLRNDMTCDREPTDRRVRAMQQAERAKLSEEEKRNPVIGARIDQRIAIRLLLEMPKEKLLLGVADGALRSILQTMLYEVGYQLKLEPRYLSTIGGRTLSERLTAFLNVLLTDRFILIWAIAQALVLLGLPVQLLGLTKCLGNPDKRAMAAFLVVTAAYFLAINLSYGNPKYGLPLNPATIVFTVAGFVAMIDWLNRRRRIPASS